MSSAQLTSALWYLGRGTGVVTLVMFTAVVVLGIITRSGRPLPGLPRFAVAELHRNVSLSAVVFLAIHMLTLLGDPYAQLRLVDLVVPFQGAYRPLWLGLGTLAADLIGVLIVTSLLRRHLGVRVWRAVHWLAYAAWPVALWHSLGTGTDSGTAWLRLVALGSAATVLVSIIWRATTGFTETTTARERTNTLTTVAGGRGSAWRSENPR